MNNCLNCGKIILPRKWVRYENLKYCNAICNSKFRQKSYIEYSKYKIKNCMVCGVTKGKAEHWFNKRLIIHHIDENPANNNPNNLLTLCKDCHSAKHRKNITNPSLVLVSK